VVTTRISRDSLESERRGRIIGEDQHKAAIRARTRELMRLDAGRGGRQAPAPRLGDRLRIRSRQWM
jgi:hypothetical protein